MKKVDGCYGKRFLSFVLIAYFFTFLFSYAYFLTIGPMVTGKSIIEIKSENEIPLDNYALEKTLTILGIIVTIVVFWIIVSFVFKRRNKKEEIKHSHYRAFKNQ